MHRLPERLRHRVVLYQPRLVGVAFYCSLATTMPQARARPAAAGAAAGATKKPRSTAVAGPATVHPSMPDVPLGPSGPASWEESLAAAKEGPPVGPGELKLITWNVASLRACANTAERKSDLQAYIAAENPGVLALQETKLQESHVPEFADLFPGYTWYATCSTEKKGYSGVGMFVRSDLEVVSHSAGIGAAQHDHEGRVYTVQLAHCTIVNAYVPNAGDGLKRLAYRSEDWDVAFREYVGKLSACSPTIVVGDMNVAHQDEDVYST